MRAIILCAGEGTRWGNHLGIPKHLIEINGEKLVERTTRLLRENGVYDILILTKEYDERYENDFSEQLVIDTNENEQGDKFLSSQYLWGNKETLLIFGDIYFTEEAIKTMVKTKTKDLIWFCRKDASRLTGKTWGEGFGFKINKGIYKRFKEVIKELQEMNLRRLAGWEVYRHFVGIKPTKHEITTNVVIIDDWTEDFDFPKDLQNWIKNYENIYNTKKD